MLPNRHFSQGRFILQEGIIVDQLGQAFLVLFKDGEEVVMRMARRFMPRIKTESEVRRLC